MYADMELEKCPFCGGEAGFRKNKDSTVWSWWKVTCNDCLCGTDYYASQAAAAEVWNRRFSTPNKPLSLDELREMDGEPVWLKSGDCCLVDVHHWFNPKFEAVAGITKYGKSLILADFVLYRRNPKEEPHEQNKN